ncbi:hypothetical protein JYT74_01965 [Crocinitomix catalasitica]|nr:hypothetical protein [Crocinitomix catalasitica]
MSKIISLYEKLIVKEIIYEVGDLGVLASCEVVIQDKKINTQFIISHTDLNRIISRIVATGHGLEVRNHDSFYMEDGTELISYSFDNLFGEQMVLENFQFVDQVKEIRA